ncbi:ABC transporter ATP-binding protein [Janibacter massiliensis]|uniref:ABC transporter ATP-binding protein n=1 Tax=Janibacter massiliensis TaxID=2058291 RepID=UPI000D0E5F0D|nr:ABC transporter ATP-binding protein [Janibacter massiliensis]
MAAGAWGVARTMGRDSSVVDESVPRGTTRRVLSYARPYRGTIAVFLVIVTLAALTSVAAPLALKTVVDDGVIPGDRRVVVLTALAVAAIAVAEAVLTLVQRWYSARIGEGLILDLRSQVFRHVQEQPIAFFTRAQTGSLVTRLNTDVIGAQAAFSSVLSGAVSNTISVALVLAAMFALSWQITLVSLLLVPLFVLAARWMGQRLAGLTREQMTMNADMGSRMTERFNVGGAMLVKLFGDPDRESAEYTRRAARVRDLGIALAVNRTFFMAALTLVAALATAIVYGLGGILAINGSLSVGTLLALAALLTRLYGPLTSLSNIRVDVMTALVSFQRIFEVLDLRPAIVERTGAIELPGGSLSVRMRGVSFAYPSADEISLRSLESTAPGDRKGSGPVLRDIDLAVEPGQLVALVGPSGSGKTTLTTLVARLYDPTDGIVEVGGTDLRDASLASVRNRIGMVTQDAHMFHDTIRENLVLAKPDATDEQIWAALDAAQVGDLVRRLPAGLETVVGDRGHRLSGGEKQRLAIARLLLRSPGVIVLDEATAHLDSESEAAVQRALDVALHGRTALVIAHRLSTVRGADQILVVQDGRIVERGTHPDLLAAGGLYADLYRTQFADA